MLELNGLNYPAIIAAWVVYMAVGAYWYSPKGFGKLWSTLSSVDIMKLPRREANQAISYVMASSLLQALTLAIILNTMKVSDAFEGVIASLVLWLGLTAATTIGTNFYARKSWKFWWLNSSFFLITMTINGLLLGGWQ